MTTKRPPFSRALVPVLVPLALLSACSAGPSDSHLGSVESNLAPAIPAVAAPAASDTAWVVQVVPVLLGRPVRSFGELKFLAVAVARWGKRVVAEAIMNDPAFVDRWANVLMDRLQVDREGTRNQEACYRQPLLTFPDQQVQAANVVLHTQRTGTSLADPQAPPPSPGTYNMADVVRGSLVLDNVFPAYRGHLFSLVTHRDGLADDESHTLGDRFTQTFLNKSSVCMQCHNTDFSCSSASFTPAYDAWHLGHETRVGFSRTSTGDVDPSWMAAFNFPPYAAGTAPFPGWDATNCGNVGSDTSIPTSATSLFPPGITNLYQLDAELKAGYLGVNQAVASGDINGGAGHAQEGRAIGAYWLAAAFTNDIWREVFGDSLTIANYVHRNDDERGVEWSLAEQSVIQNRWSLKTLLRTIVTGNYFDRVVEATPAMPQVFEPFLHPEGPYTADFAGDAVHRRSADLLFRMKASAMGWITSDSRHVYVSSFPSSTAASNPLYPTHDDAQAMSLYLSPVLASQRTPTMSQIGLLGWEASAGRCERPAGYTYDWIDGLVDRAIAPGITIRDALDALRYRVLGRGITHDASGAADAGLPDGGTLSTEEVALQAFLGRSLGGAFASASDAQTTLRNVCGVFTKTAYFLLEGAHPEGESVDFNTPPTLQVGNVHPPDFLHGIPAGLNSDTPNDACRSWDYYFEPVLPPGAVWDCASVEFPFTIPWTAICPRLSCFYYDELRYHPWTCLSCPPGSEWTTVLPPIDARNEYTTPPMEPMRTGMFLVWTETATISFVSGQAQIVRANGKVETSIKAGAQLAVGDGLELFTGAQFKLTGADGKLYQSPPGGMPKSADGGTWLFKATGKSALPPPSTAKTPPMDAKAALAQSFAIRNAALNEEPGSVAFMHTVTAPSGNSSFFDDPTTNGDAKRLLIVSPIAGAVTNKHAVGTWYDGKRWAVYNEDGAAMPVGAQFAVRSMAASSYAFLHTTTKTNVSAHITFIDDGPVVNQASIVNGQPYAALQVTHLYNAPGLSGTYENHPVGVYYDGTRWAIYNEDLAAMPVGTAFVVKLGGFETFTSSAATRNGNALVVDQADINGQPGASLFLSHNYDPPGAPTAYATKVAALAYDSKLAKWTIVNLDGSMVADGVSYNVHRAH